MYDVFFSETVLRQLKRLDKHVQKRIISAIERIRIRPGSFVKRLVGMPYFRLRAGDYRVILDIRQEKMVIMVVYVNPRKSVYK